MNALRVTADEMNAKHIPCWETSVCSQSSLTSIITHTLMLFIAAMLLGCC